VGPSGTDWKKLSVEASDIKVLSLDLGKAPGTMFVDRNW